jgi:hypothetical protein
MRTWVTGVGLSLLLAGCNGEGKGEECDPADAFAVFVDADGDGFGSEPAGQVCAVGEGQAEDDGDCDDDDARVHPEATERCNGLDDDCDDALDDGLEGRVFFRDGDGDGFGDHDDALTACSAPDGRVLDDTDCNDAVAGVNPDAVEVCSEGVDEDCDGLADDEDDSVDVATMTAFYFDADADGFGDPERSRPSCAQPVGAAPTGDDCDDERAEVNPGAAEVCNQRDDDCDTLFDHLDDSIDPALLIPGFADADSDGHGDPATPIDTCGFRPGIAAELGDDCNDADDTVRPSAPERPCDLIDNDCDVATIDNPDRDLDGTATCDGDCDDLDDTIFPGAAEIPADGIDSDCDTEELCYRDGDDDGLRNDVATPGGADPFCEELPNRPPEVAIDCDDTDAAVDWSGDWVEDLDGDGYGSGSVVLSATCADPGAGFAPLDRAEDCDESDPLVSPGEVELCGDGLDANCDGTDDCRTCEEYLQADPAAATGVYTLRPERRNHDVYCDMDADGGGWTLVGAASGVGVSLDNYGVTSSAGLDDPGGAFVYTGGIWDGLVPVVGDVSDVRFVCLLAAGADPEVDLSFYEVDWYALTTQPFGQSCFQPTETPARRNNRTGDELPASDPYDSGALVGEDLCGAFDDFTVDFDDAGMNSDESDGTDWGNDDYVAKCGTAGSGYAWFVFVR